MRVFGDADVFHVPISERPRGHVQVQRNESELLQGIEGEG